MKKRPSDTGLPVQSPPSKGFSAKGFMTLLIFVTFQSAIAQPAAAPLAAQQQSSILPGGQNASMQKTDSLFRSIRSGSAMDLERQLAAGADPNDSLDGYSALMIAALAGSVTQMKMLIGHGAQVNARTQRGISALWLAVPDREKTSLLLDHGADARQTIDGYGILVKLAAIPGTIDLFHQLLEKGADLKTSAPDNFLLYNAASSGDTAILGFLLHSGLKVNDSVSFGDYPLNAALAYRTFPTVKMLIDHGADPNIRSMTSQLLPQIVGFTPLMNAALSNDRTSFFYLLDHGADPNLKSKKGYTALMLLEQSEIDDPEMTLALIRHGANITEKAPDGTDALYYAKKKGNTPSVELLKRYTVK